MAEYPNLDLPGPDKPNWAANLPGARPGTIRISGHYGRSASPPPPSGRSVPLRWRIPHVDMDFGYGWRAWLHRWKNRLLGGPPGLWDAERMLLDQHRLSKRGADQDEWDRFHYRHRRIVAHCADPNVRFLR